MNYTPATFRGASHPPLRLLDTAEGGHTGFTSSLFFSHVRTVRSIYEHLRNTYVRTIPEPKTPIMIRKNKPFLVPTPYPYPYTKLGIKSSNLHAEIWSDI